jgi:uncharacterized cupin superfamily protein
VGAAGEGLGSSTPCPSSPHEEYEVLEGSLDVLIGGEWRTLTAGEAASVPAGMVHTFRGRLLNAAVPALAAAGCPFGLRTT